MHFTVTVISAQDQSKATKKRSGSFGKQISKTEVEIQESNVLLSLSNPASIRLLRVSEEEFRLPHGIDLALPSFYVVSL